MSLAGAKFVTLHHRTEYRYERPVLLGPQTVRLRPAPYCRTAIQNYALTVEPVDHRLRWQFDVSGNHVAQVGFADRVGAFVFTVELQADLTPYNPFDFVLSPGFETFPFRYTPELAAELTSCRELDAASPLLNDFIHSFSVLPQPTVDFLVGLNGRVRNRVGYVTRMEQGVQSCEQTLAKGTGSCRDSAWLLVQMLRRFGFAARFVSGYLIQLADEDVPDAPKKDSADLHAWAEVYLPGAGWVGMDATSGLLTAEGHIPLAASPTVAGAAPLSGTMEPAQVEFHHSMWLRTANTDLLSEPFSEAEWDRVRAVAHSVDAALEAGEAHLTMGGEPTFVSMDDPGSPQWNLAALGPAKRDAGLHLIRSLRERTAPGGLLHLGQGKWYPGEPLPRWAFHCISRVDGVPVWQDASLFANEQQDYGYGNAEALQFLQALCRRLEASADDILAAFNPFVEEGSASAGYVLPLRRRQANGRIFWSSQLWFDRPERLTLTPGDSPVGYRIPVEAMPWVVPDTVLYPTGPDSSVLLPDAPARCPHLFDGTAPADPLPPVPESTEPSALLVRPALCVEAREGRLHVFLPFIPVLADYLDLIAAVEETAARLGKPVWVEGYPPNPEPRIRFFSLTPDPGVLEVNLPPASTWAEMESASELLAEEAARLRLRAGKFDWNGTHLATGGGSHITLGGRSPLESPLLRRPDVLRSMVTFWQNHPSLSYLFAGMYVGPTSQYPRVDEARTDALYELELAFRHLPDQDCPPYVVDGLFRNLLVDVTGNSHRAEFCIDKLWPPEGQGLRIGLLELRAFEMPPHHRMDLLQRLLVRALVAAFWKAPYRAALVRWDTALHDRFMLPHFVQHDFQGVLDFLRQAGFTLQAAWFEAHLRFRFPLLGSVSAEGVAMELRQALEPWNVLAEEATAGGTGRSVDSSLERIQVRVTGLHDAVTYAVLCNGRPVPLTPTGMEGEAIAGVRYRARSLAVTLHPTIPVHMPLTFELVDTQSNRVAARCMWHGSRPDGSLYDALPADAAEAKLRRRERFVTVEASGENVIVAVEPENPLYPMTLDMRWPAV